MIRVDPAAIGPSLGELRQLLGINQRDLAADAHLFPSQLSSWERGLRTPDLKSLVKLAGALGYDLALIPREDS